MNFENSVLSYFGELEDPRSGHNLTHPFMGLRNPRQEIGDEVL